MGLAFGNTASTASTPFLERVKRLADPSKVISVPTPASVQINPGDLVFLDTSVPCARLASNIAWDSTLAATQVDAATVFLGISLDQKNAADPTTREIRVLWEGEAVYPCAALGQAQHIGDGVACAKDSGGNNLLDQQVAINATPASALGVLSREAASGATSLTFYFFSTLMRGAHTAA